MDSDTLYKHSLLKTSEALNIATASLRFAIDAIESGTPSSYALSVLQKDLRKIEGLMVS